MKKNSLLLLLVFCFLMDSMTQVFETKLDSLVALMTDEEKIMQLHQYGVFNTLDNDRLNIPGLFMSDGPHGIKQGRSTSFPTGMGMAASWDTDLIYRVGKAMGMEFWGKYIQQALGPCMDLCWDPRNGRSPETGGEDPLLCGEMATALAIGIQEYPVIATAKHFNGVAMQNNRFHNDVIVSEKMLMDHYGYNFRTAVQKGNVFSIMNAFNLINEVNCAENKNLLDTILRQKWGFPYYVVSDWGAVWETQDAIEAGVNICMGSYLYRDELPGLVKSGDISGDLLDKTVKGVLRAKMLAGFVGYFPQGNHSMVDRPEHRTLCREAGRKSIVLLKNEGDILPLDKDEGGTIALIGPAADEAFIDGRGSSSVTPYYTISPVEGITAVAGEDNVTYSKGCDINSNDTSLFAEARELAAGADYVFFFGGLGPTMEGEVRDRNGSTDLPGQQLTLINELAKVNSNIIIVVYSGGICSMHPVINKVKGFIYGFYPGQEGGNAIADIIFGDFNPSAKLPVTMPVSEDQLPERNLNYNDDYGSGYRWFDRQDIQPEFPFGFGLSYTTYSYSNIQLNETEVPAGDPVSVSIDVENSGNVAGEEIVQLYLSHENPGPTDPLKELKAFKVVQLEPNEKKTVTFSLTANEFYQYSSENGGYMVDTGMYVIKIGRSSTDPGNITQFRLLPAVGRPDLQITKVYSYPRYPIKGEPVTFVASVVNYGTAPLDGSIKIEFGVNDKKIFASNNQYLLKPGQSTLVGADGSILPGDVAEYTFTAKIDPENLVEETIESNNSSAGSFAVHDSSVLAADTISYNIALNKPATATNYQDSLTTAAMAVDGNRNTRWGVADRWTDVQNLTVDLLEKYFIDSIKVYWDPIAYPERLKFLFKDTADKWVTAKLIDPAYSGYAKYDSFIDISTRYVKLRTLKRHTGWIPYSLFEMEVYGRLDTATFESPDTTTNINLFTNMEVEKIYPNPFKDKLYVTYSVYQREPVNVDVHDLTGKLIANLTSGMHNPGKYYTTWNGKNSRGRDVPPGTYVITISTRGYHKGRIVIRE